MVGVCGVCTGPVANACYAPSRTECAHAGPRNFSCGKIWGKRFDGDLCATLHRCTIHVTATVGTTRQMVLDGCPCATLHRCTYIYMSLLQLVQQGNGSGWRSVCNVAPLHITCYTETVGRTREL